MPQFEIEASLTISRQEDGSLVAIGNELPIFIVAKDMDRLRKKLAMVSEALSLELEGLGDADGANDRLQALGIRVERIGDEGTISMPVLVGGPA